MAIRQAVRNVAEEQIYDTYMGILRISPNINPSSGATEDSASSLFLRLGEEIELSDSIGNKMALKFVPKASEMTVLSKNGRSEVKDVVNMTHHVDTFYTNNLSVRSKIIINDKDLLLDDLTSRKSNLYIIKLRDKTLLEKFNTVLAWPIDNPYDDNYFNNFNKLNLVDRSKGESTYDEQLEQSLIKKTPDWYKNNISENEKIRINGDYILYPNTQNEPIPAVNKRTYVMGAYKEHCGSTVGTGTEAADRFLPESGILDSGVEKFTKLSFANIDNIIWTLVDEILNNGVRHSRGRYTGLGANGEASESLESELYNKLTRSTNSNNIDYSIARNAFEDNSFKVTAPLLGQDVPRGGIYYTAIPQKRLMFYQYRQKLLNEKDKIEYLLQKDGFAEERLKEETDKRLKEKHPEYNENLITPFKRLAKGFTNNVSKNFLLCTGREINLENYPYMNTSNKDVFEMTQGYTYKENVRDEHGTPIAISGDARPYVSKMIEKTPCLLKPSVAAPRYIRSLNWCREGDPILGATVEGCKDYVRGNRNTAADPIFTINARADISGDVITKPLCDGNNVYKNNEYVYENIKYETGDDDADKKSEYDYKKDINEVKAHRANYAFKFNTIRHRHFMFVEDEGQYDTTDMNIMFFGHMSNFDTTSSTENAMSRNGTDTFPFADYITNKARRFIQDPLTWDLQGPMAEDLPSISDELKWGPAPTKAFSDYMLGNAETTKGGGKPVRNAALFGLDTIPYELLKENNAILTEKEGTIRKKVKRVRIMANELEARVPLANKGGYKGVNIHGQCSTDRGRHHRRKLRTNWYAYSGAYDMKTVKSGGKWRGKWRCLSSLPYYDPDNLGKLFDNEGNYIFNAVTQNKYTGDTIVNEFGERVVVNKKSPNPPTLLLTPIIRY